MSYPNLMKYAKFEKAIRKVGDERLKAYVASKGHKINKFERNMQVIRYTLQHGTHAASTVFHMSSSYPSQLIYLYGNLAIELLENIEKENNT